MILDGKQLSQELKDDMRQEVDALAQKYVSGAEVAPIFHPPTHSDSGAQFLQSKHPP